MTLLSLYALLALASMLLAFWRPPRMPRYALLLLIAGVPQLGGILGIWIPGMFLVSAATVAVWCLCNRDIAGILVAAAGLIMNLLAMALHGGAMPIDADTLVRIGVGLAPGTLLSGSKDIVVQSSPLWLLSDWIVLATDPITLIASPGDMLVLSGLICWLLFSPALHEEKEKEPPMLMTHSQPSPMPDGRVRLISGHSTRPALTRLALLAAANPTFAESLMRDPVGAGSAHPHYAVSLDARDCATLVAISSRTRTVGEFLGELANVVDGA